MQDFNVSTDPNKVDLEVVFKFVSDSYWAKGIPRKTLVKAVQNSLVFGVYENNRNMVGFARVVTDKATFAYLGDVFVLPAFQGKGLAKLLMQSIVSHPDIQGLRRFMLATRDAHSLYAQFGFQTVENSEMLMQIWQPSIYSK